MHRHHSLPDSEVFRFVQLSKQADRHRRLAWFNLPSVKLMLTKCELSQVKWSNFPRCLPRSSLDPQHCASPLSNSKRSNFLSKPPPPPPRRPLINHPKPQLGYTSIVHFSLTPQLSALLSTLKELLWCISLLLTLNDPCIKIVLPWKDDHQPPPCSRI